jgi:AbrB family looped-hinge helix DNA binding protein
MWEIPTMTTVEMKDRGRIVLPKVIRERLRLEDGALFECLDNPNGDLVLRQVHGSPKVDLIDHLKGFKGIEFPERKSQCPPRL